MSAIGPAAGAAESFEAITGRSASVLESPNTEKAAPESTSAPAPSSSNDIATGGTVDTTA